MCDEKTIGDANEHLRRARLTRREFGALSIGTGLAMLLPRAANAQEVTASNVEVTTPDGTADCYFVHPTTGTHPAVLIWPDGARPAPRVRADGAATGRVGLLGAGRQSLLPHGAGARCPRGGELPGRGHPQHHLCADGESERGDPLRRRAGRSSATLDAQDSVDTSRKVGTMGYCMGGPITMRTAAAVPDRVGAGASFHGGGARHRPARQPAPAGRRHAGALPLRHCRERRRERPRGEERAARGLRSGRAAGPRSRSTRAHSTAGARPTCRSTTRPRRSAPGAGCWCCSRQPWRR